MGGAQAGEVASQMAVEEFHEALPDEGSAEERLVDRVRAANRRIYDLSRTEHERAGMGTTLTAVYLDDDHLAVAHVGDSRAYLFRDGELTRLTQDHSLVEELVRQGKLTEEQAAEHPQRSIITRALGIERDVEVDTWTYPMRAGDVVLLCSDGLTSMIGEEQIAQILAGEASLDRAADRLIDAANDAGGRDNITVVLFRLEETSGRAAASGDVDEPTVVGMEPVRAPTRTATRAGAEAAETEPPSPRRPEPTQPRRDGGAVLTAPPPQLAAGERAPARGWRGRRAARRPAAARPAPAAALHEAGGGADRHRDRGVRWSGAAPTWPAASSSSSAPTPTASSRSSAASPTTCRWGSSMYEQFYVSGRAGRAPSRPTAARGCSTISCARRGTRSASCTPPSSASWRDERTQP